MRKAKLLDYANDSDPAVVRRYARFKSEQNERLRSRYKKADAKAKKKIKTDSRLRAIEAQLAENNGGRRLTLNEAAAYMKCSTKTVRRACASGDLEFERLGSSQSAEYRFKKSALDKYLVADSNAGTLIKTIVHRAIQPAR